MIDTSTIYLLPGRGGKLDYLGSIISSMGFDVCGRETIPPFSNLSFSKQLHFIKRDLKSLFWNDDSKLIGKSYGGYLLLHALSELDPFPGKILLLSPVLGAALDRQNLYCSRPPRADKLLELAKANKIPTPRSLKIYTGSEDKGCRPDFAEQIGSSIRTASVNIMQGQGHGFPSQLTEKILRRFLK